MSDSKLTNEVMMRVRFIHLVKRVMRPFAIEVVVFAAALLEMGRIVFVAKVFENAPSVGKFNEALAFFAQAFAHTEGYVQVLVLAVAVVGILAFKDTIKTVRALRELRYRTI